MDSELDHVVDAGDAVIFGAGHVAQTCAEDQDLGGLKLLVSHQRTPDRALVEG